MSNSQWHNAARRTSTPGNLLAFPDRCPQRPGTCINNNSLRIYASYGIYAIMQIPHEAIAIRQVADRLVEIFGVPELAEDTHIAVRSNDGRQWDALFAARDLSFVLEWKRSGSPGHVAAAIRQLEMAKHSFPHEVIPLLAVPYMGEAAQELCAQAELLWLDLSGNARIIAPGIFYQNLGNPNRFSPRRTTGERIRTKRCSDSTMATHGTHQAGKAAQPGLQHRSG